jgi:uncharacterized protein YndB with AHSA1/START domain
MSKLYKGYLLIADISGYTIYLNESELEHAEQTLTALLEMLVEHTRPPLIISRLEGDAVISYGLQDTFFKGQTFVEVIENTYVAFRKTIELLVLNTSCMCNACANISTLDLKFFFHYGSFAIQHIGDHDELVGSDVNLVHRLLKNRVREETGFKAYSLYTDAAIQQLHLEEISASMMTHNETAEHLGEVKVWVQDMHSVWEQKRGTTQIEIPPEQIVEKVEIDISMPPEVVWDYLTQPEFRTILVGSDRQEITNRSDGRIAPGSVYQCYHGDMVIPQTILEWQPFERMIIQQLIPLPFPNTTILIDCQLVPIEKGTQLVQVASKAKGPLLGRIVFNTIMGPLTAKSVEKRTEEFKSRIEEDFLAKRVVNRDEQSSAR